MFKTEKGSALILSVVLILLVIVIIAAVVALNQLNFDIVNKSYNKSMAERAARSGMSEAIYNLNEDINWQAGFANKEFSGGLGNYTVTFSMSGGDSYSTKNILTSASVTGYNQRIVPGGYVHIVSSGKYKNAVKIAESLLKVTAMLPSPLSCQGGISVGNNAFIDGYDSSAGMYGDGNKEITVDIGTNGNTMGIVSLANNSTVYGNVIVGPGSIIGDAISLGSGAELFGQRLVGTQIISFPEITMPPGINQGDRTFDNDPGAALAPGNYGSLILGNNCILTLSSGLYSFSGNIEVGNNSKFVIDSASGPVKVYANSSINFVNNSDIMPSRPQDLIIYGTDNCTSITVNNNAMLSCVFIARKAVLNIVNNGGFYGGIVANSLNLCNLGQIHLDNSITFDFYEGIGHAVLKMVSSWNN